MVSTAGRTLTVMAGLWIEEMFGDEKNKATHASTGRALRKNCDVNGINKIKQKRQMIGSFTRKKDTGMMEKENTNTKVRNE
ncbi:hypothetical protein WICPIJ_009479 [Wickerhamomyces pijperi]|uniref:Uncharacterized protein n=1 Tax=Wickerhamomyces pijperi TaxID=599730 RepID=A0A9P8PMF5_WICPI|nr:hypothetical protein WICPIJ_009479 [Wickerhamomyces pijperi]